MQCYVLRRNKIIRSREIANAIARLSLSSSYYVTVQLLHSYPRSFVPLQHYYVLFILRYDSYDVEIFRISTILWIYFYIELFKQLQCRVTVNGSITYGGKEVSYRLDRLICYLYDTVVKIDIKTIIEKEIYRTGVELEYKFQLLEQKISVWLNESLLIKF